MHLQIFDLDGSLRAQSSLINAADWQSACTFDLRDLGPRLRLWSRNATMANAQGKLEEIRAATSAMMSELRLYQSYGELESAYGQMLATLGLDPLPAETGKGDLKSIEQSIDREQARWAQFGHADGVKAQ